MATVNAGVATVSPVADTGTAHVLDTAVAYTSGIIASFKSNNVQKATIDWEGSFAGKNAVFTGTSTLTGTVGIGLAGAVDRRLQIAGTTGLTGTTQYGTVHVQTFDSTATAQTFGFWSRIQTEAAVYTMTGGTNYYVSDAVIGAGSTLTTQYGFRVANLTSGATNWAVFTEGTTPSSFGGAVTIIGILTALATSATLGSGNVSTHWDIAGTRAFIGYDATNAVLQGGVGKGIALKVNNATFGSGTDALVIASSGDATFSGNVGIGAAGATDRKLFITGTQNSSASDLGLVVHPDYGALVNTIRNVFSRVDTLAAVFTVSTAQAFYVADAVLGAGSILTTQYGYYVDDLTAGGTNWAFFSAGTTPSSFGGDVTVGGDLVVSGVGPHAIGGGTSPAIGFFLRGTFTASTLTAGTAFMLGTDLVGGAGQTTRLTMFESGASTGNSSITTQGAAETISAVSTMELSEPNITVGAGDTVTNASTLRIVSAPTEGTNNYALFVDSGTTRLDGSFAATFVGPHVIGVDAFLTHARLRIGGGFTSDGSAAVAYGLVIDGTVTGAATNTTALASAKFEGVITTQTETESISVIAQAMFSEPVITDNLTGDITVAATVYVANEPTEGNGNAAIWVNSGSVRVVSGDVTISSGDLNLTGALNHDGTTIGFYSTAPIAQQTGVAVTAAGIHAACVALGLFTA